MVFPRLSLSVFAAGFLCLGICAPVSANKAPEPDSLPVSLGGEAPVAASSSSPQAETIVIPGPLRSFLRMAAISQETALDEVLPMLARNVSLQGFQDGKKTEYLVLVNRYVHQARELQLMAGADGVIRIVGCDDANRLIRVLGYRFQQACSQKNASLMTANPERAFLTVDSGFPITGLEEALQKGTTFTYSFPATQVPILFTEKDWTAVSMDSRRISGGLLDVLLNDPNVDSLYWGLSRSDRQTRAALMRSHGLRKLLPMTAVLDKYGSQIRIRSQGVVVPGGTGAERGWQELTGASPRSPGEFVTHLLTKDHGWLAAYFDALSRVGQTQQVRLAEGARLKLLYEAYRSTASRISASAGVFPNNADLLMLFTRVQWDQAGEPQVPGDLDVWKEIFIHQPGAKGMHDWVKSAHGWDSPERLLAALAASSNIFTDSGPLQIYLALSAMDSERPTERHLSEATVRLLADRFSEYRRWYLIFTEFSALDDASITSFIDAADRISKISNSALRSNALGAFQAEVGLWQIFTRQGQIPVDRLNASWQNTVRPFTEASSSLQLFDAARNSLQAILVAVSGKADFSQDEVIDLLAGPAQKRQDGQRVHEELAGRISAVMDDQRLVSLDTLFGLYDGLAEMEKGKAANDGLLRLAGELREFEMPAPIFTNGERASWSPQIYISRHAELQVRTDLTKVIQSPGSPAQLEAARAKLAPFLRDTLVGLNYAYYEPPGAQALHNNPLFVRSHDFAATSIQGFDRVWGAPDLVGIGATAGGGAYLIGSLADLPYALAEMEEDFIAPEKVQALIWREAVPGLMVDAMLPRWWNVSPTELHAASLYQRRGEELLMASATDSQLREKVIGILSDRMTPERLERTEQALLTSESAAGLPRQMLPAETFYLAAEFRKRFPGEALLWGQAGKELEGLSQKDPSNANPQRLSKEFGVPHPTLAQSNSSSLLNTEPIPAFGGDANRLFGESWESSNLYWARLADEMGFSPVALNVLAPELTRHMIANIFATNFEDWPALLRAMEETGDEFRQGKITVQAVSANSLNPVQTP